MIGDVRFEALTDVQIDTLYYYYLLHSSRLLDIYVASIHSICIISSLINKGTNKELFISRIK